MAASAGVADQLAAKSSPAVVTTTAPLKARSAMLSKLRHGYLSRGFAGQHLMTFAATDSFALRVDLVGESVIVSLAHRRRRFLVSRSRVTFAAVCPAHLLAGLNLIGSLMANVAFAVRRERGPRSRDCVTARAIGSPLAAHVTRVRLVRELSSKGLPLGECQHFRLHCLYPFVTIGANAKLFRSELPYVAGDASPMAGHHRFDRIRPSHMARIALDLTVPLRCMVELTLRLPGYRILD
jgi:hypothetical protein